MKCGEEYLTEMCKKDIHTKPKCALCDEGHPANYKGCRVYQELIKRSYPTSDRRKIHTSNTIKGQYKPDMDEYPGLKTYPESNLETSRIYYTHTRIKNAQSYARAVTNQPADIGNVIKESFSRFEKILKQQAEQISSVLNLLTILISKIN